jgi:superfamily II DNA or RNA helicase
LQDKGYLAKLRYYADPSIDLSGLKTDSTGDWRRSMIGDAMDKPKLIGDIVSNWLRIAKGTPTVCFASSQAHARHLAEEFASVGYRFEYLDCNTPDDERQEIFHRIKQGKSTGIVNYSIVGVGVDIPNLKCCILARPTKLITNYHQYVGRITRPTDGTEGIVIDHAGIIERLGFLEDEIEWTLDGKETVEERLKKKKEERKEPKEITCGDCGTVFKSRKTCPTCGYEMIKLGEPIPVYEADLKEIKQVKKPTPAEKSRLYSEFLGYSRRHGKSDSYALALFRSKFNEWPHNKRSIHPSEPTQEALNYIKHQQIKWAKGRAA